MSERGLKIVEFDNKLTDYRFFLQRLILKIEKPIKAPIKSPPIIMTINATTLN